MELMYTMFTPYGLAVLPVLAHNQRVTTTIRKYYYLASYVRLRVHVDTYSANVLVASSGTCRYLATRCYAGHACVSGQRGRRFFGRGESTPIVFGLLHRSRSVGVQGAYIASYPVTNSVT